MKPVISLILLSLLLSCSKNSTTILPPSGIWIEQSLRLDTLDFESANGTFTSSGYSTLLFKSNPPSFWSISSYYFKTDSIFLRSFLSSSTLFASYKFQMATNQQTFNVSRFYNRNSLPATLTFEKIK